MSVSIRSSGDLFRLLCIFLLVLGSSAPTLAQTPTQPLQISIPAGDLAEALDKLGAQSGTQIMYEPAMAAGKTVPAVRGTFTVDDALSKLLVKTGLRANRVNEKTVVLQRAASAPVAKAKPTVPEDPPAGGDPENKLAEIVVTAQKRAENLQNVPLAVQVISGQTLIDQNQTTLEELSRTLPAVHVGGNGGTDMFIRGVGSGDNASFDQSVSTFIDDTYVGRSRMTLASFLDVDRIEVLKGPQSTFFGNSAIAGAVNIVTKKPGDTFDAWGRLLYGSYDRYAAEGAIGGPVTDTLSVRVAATRNGIGEGWIHNVYTGEDAPRINNEAARLTVDFHPEGLDATLKVEGARHRTGGTANDDVFQITNCPPPLPITPAGSGDLGTCANALALNAKVAGTVPIGLNGNLNAGLPGQFQDLNNLASVLTVSVDAWNQKFTSVTGYYGYHFLADGDGNQVPQFVLTSQAAERYHQISQEFRVASPTGGLLEYIAGIYAQVDSLYYNSNFNLPLFGPLFGPLPEFGPYLPLANSFGSDQTEHNYSAFGSLTWNVNDRLKVSGSLRASQVSKGFDAFTSFGHSTQMYGGFMPLPLGLQQEMGGILGTPVGVSPTATQTNNALMPSARVQYQLDNDVMAYFRFDRGFKAGGFNGSSGYFGSSSQLEYGPEFVNAYELGLKSKWLDDTLLANVDVFLSDYANLQTAASYYIASLQTYAKEVRNAASSRSEGVEFQGQWLVTPDFHLSADFTYLRSYYKSFPNATLTILQAFCGSNPALAGCVAAFPNGAPPVQNLSGRPTDFAPRVSGSLVASYSVRLPRQLRLTAELIPYFTSNYFLDSGATDDPLDLVGGYVRLDARLGLKNADGRWTLDLIGKNLTDRVIVSGRGSWDVQTKEEPRNVAIQFGYHY